MKGIFISYRRDDTASEARLLYNYVRREFGDDLVFMDVEALREPGADFIDAIHKSLNDCDAVLAVMGRRWAGFDGDTGSSRLDAPGDFIRMEIAMALQRRVRVIPVLVDGASMPPAETLPEDLRSLTRLQAVTLSHEDWDFHIGKLLDGLAKTVGYKRRAGATAPLEPGSARRWPWLAGGALLGVAALATVALMVGGVNEDGQVSLPPGTRMATAPVVETQDAAGVAMSDPAAVVAVAQPRSVATTSSAIVATTPQPPPVSATSTAIVATTPQPPPVSAKPPAVLVTTPPVNPVADRSLVTRAQQLLSMLGYQPGPADGVSGPATTQALRAFQQAWGVGGAPGQVSETLVAALERAVEGVEAANAAAVSAVRDLSGVWYSEEGVGFNVAHDGDGMVWYLNGELVGEGLVAGDNVEMLYNIGGAVMGHIAARVDADGRHMRGVDSSSDGTVQAIVLHNGHLAE